MADSTAEVFSAAKFTHRADSKGLSGRELAAQLGVTPTTLSAIRNGRRAPSMDLLCKVVEKLGGVPADYLSLPDRQRWTLRHFRMAAGMTQLAVAAEVGATAAAVASWESRRYKPPRAVLPRLAVVYAATEAELDAAVDRHGVVTPADGMVAAGQSAVGLAVAALDAAESLSASRRRALALNVRGHVEHSLEALAGAVRDLPEDEVRATVVDLVRQLAELHADADNKSK
ncbi:helix-turn-helix transcriptional regulator [Mycolicibacterium sp. Y3]